MQGLTDPQIKAVKTALYSDNESTYEQLMEYFTLIVKISESTAADFLKLRGHYYNNPNILKSI